MKYRIYPNKIQIQLIEKHFGSIRFLYNYFLNYRQKAKLKVQKLHTKINNQRKDYLHKISDEITNQYDIICLETLSVREMMSNRRLAKSIAYALIVVQVQEKNHLI